MSRRSAMAAALVAALVSWTAQADPSVRAPATATAAARGVAEAAKASEPRATEGVVNLNDANEDQLAYLPGIGPAKAKAIIEHRHGHPFRRADELTKVKGIGRKTFGRLRPYVTIAGPTTLTTDVKPHR